MMKISATLLILSSVLHFKAVSAVFHETIQVVGCSHPDQNTDAEAMQGLDGEVVVYADFTKGKAEEPQPDFMTHITFPHSYEAAQGFLADCQYNLKQHLTAMKNPPVELDVEQDQPSVGPDVFCGVGLTLGLLGVAMGTFLLIKGNECN